MRAGQRRRYAVGVPRVLVVANQTLRGPELERVIRERLRRGPCEFVVAVPVTKADDLISVDQYGVPMPRGTLDQRMEQEEAEQLARNRLDSLLVEIHRCDAVAEGFLGDADPWRTFKEAVDSDTFDEVIVSTLAPGVSRWLRMDLVSRIDRAFDGQVTAIVAGS